MYNVFPQVVRLLHLLLVLDNLWSVAAVNVAYYSWNFLINNNIIDRSGCNMFTMELFIYVCDFQDSSF